MKSNKTLFGIEVKADITWEGLDSFYSTSSILGLFFTTKICKKKSHSYDLGLVALFLFQDTKITFSFCVKLQTDF